MSGLGLQMGAAVELAGRAAFGRSGLASSDAWHAVHCVGHIGRSVSAGGSLFRPWRARQWDGAK